MLQAALNKLRAEADGLVHQVDALLANYPVPQVLSIPEYYTAPKQHMEAKRCLDVYSRAVFTLCLAYKIFLESQYVDAVEVILNAWIRTNRETDKRGDSDLCFCYKGQRFVDGLLLAELTGYEDWVRTVYLRAAKRADHWMRDNKRSWSLFGEIITAVYLQKPKGEIIALKDRVVCHVINNVNADGDLWKELFRNNNAMRYTYFSLAPLTRCAWVLEKYIGINGLWELLEKPLHRFFWLCSDARNRWPLKGCWMCRKYRGILGWFQQLLFASSDEVRWPSPKTWPGNLYDAISPVYGVKEWNEWVAPHRPINYGSTWLFSTVFSFCN